MKSQGALVPTTAQARFHRHTRSNFREQYEPISVISCSLVDKQCPSLALPNQLREGVNGSSNEQPCPVGESTKVTLNVRYRALWPLACDPKHRWGQPRALPVLQSNLYMGRAGWHQRHRAELRNWKAQDACGIVGQPTGLGRSSSWVAACPMPCGPPLWS